tara:strand:- start:24 stop:434 length:411 start_codon:yes stop_codon:yes gene_type:complete
MAAYTVTQMTAGVLGEVLTGGTDYTFTIATPAYASQSVYFGSAAFLTDSSLFTNYNLSQSAIAAGINESNFSGTFDNFTFDVSQSNFISSSCGFAFNIKQAIGTGAGSFDFTPAITIPASSYLIKSTGHITLNITS